MFFDCDIIAFLDFNTAPYIIIIIIIIIVVAVVVIISIIVIIIILLLLLFTTMWWWIKIIKSAGAIKSKIFENLAIVVTRII